MPQCRRGSSINGLQIKLPSLLPFIEWLLIPLLTRKDKVGEAVQKLLSGLNHELGLILSNFWKIVHGHWEMWSVQKLDAAFDVHQQVST